MITPNATIHIPDVVTGIVLPDGKSIRLLDETIVRIDATWLTTLEGQSITLRPGDHVEMRLVQ